MHGVKGGIEARFAGRFVPVIATRSALSGIDRTLFVVYVTVVSGGRLTHRCASATAWPESGTPNPTLWLTRNPALFVLTSGSARSKCRAERTKICCTSRQVRSGLAESSSAAKPLICGTENEVPTTRVEKT